MMGIRKIFAIGLLSLAACTEGNPDYGNADLNINQVTDMNLMKKDISSIKDSYSLDDIMIKKNDLSFSQDLKSVKDINELEDLIGIPDLTENVDLYSPDLKQEDLAQPPDMAIPCYTNNFMNDKDLVIQSGGWQINNGELDLPIVPGGCAVAYLNNQPYKDFTAKVKILVNDKNRGGDYFGLIFRYIKKSPNGYDINIDQGYVLDLDHGDGNGFLFSLSEICQNRLQTANVNSKYAEWHDLEVRAKGTEIKAYFDGVLKFTTNQKLHDEGNIGFYSYSASGSFKDLEICPQ